ncbi:MAG: ACT domain-containing protein, partial [Termitinemataceae bacterium]
CNIEESRMTILGGDFAILMLVSGSADMLQNLVNDRSILEERLGLSIQIRHTSGGIHTEGFLPYQLESSSLDTPGIVHGVSAILRKHGINITDLETNTESAPLTGAPLFTMKARILIPSTLSIATLRKELEELELQYNLDIRLSPMV